MGVPHSISTERKATKVTQFFGIDEIRALHARFSELVPPGSVVFLEHFQAYCLWTSVCKPATAAVLFRGFDFQRRGYFDYEDFLMTLGALTRGTSDKVSDVLFRMLSDPDAPGSKRETATAALEAAMGAMDTTSLTTTTTAGAAAAMSEKEKEAERESAAAKAASQEALDRLLLTPAQLLEKKRQQEKEKELQALLPVQDDRFIRYEDVVAALKCLDETFLMLRCDGGLTAESVAARLPFNEYGVLSIDALKDKVGTKLQ